jgi:alpha-D-ribose 1-methylphosphonate 5-triphosphate synthase subunit PhnH
MSPLVCRGLADPVHDAGQIFRRLLDAAAHPGRLFDLLDTFSGLEDAPSGHLRPLAAALLALADYETPVWVDADPSATLRSLLAFHCNAPVAAEPHAASFAVITRAVGMPALTDYAWGSAEYPDRGATLLISVADLQGGRPITLSGPGIDGTVTASPLGLPDDFWRQRSLMQREFPCGVDCFLFDDRHVVGLPRTTRTEETE